MYKIILAILLVTSISYSCNMQYGSTYKDLKGSILASKSVNESIEIEIVTDLNINFHFIDINGFNYKTINVYSDTGFYSYWYVEYHYH